VEVAVDVSVKLNVVVVGEAVFVMLVVVEMVWVEDEIILRSKVVEGKDIVVEIEM